LPLGIEGRAELEVSTALWTAAVALVIGSALKPRWSWPLLTGATAIACTLAALIGLPVSTMSAVLLVTAASLALLVRKQLRGPAKRPERKRRMAA